MPEFHIDLYSDTQTRPTKAMRQAMARAEVGDEQHRDDPTVNRLVDMVCGLLGKEDALFVHSGTMCNQIAFRVFTRPGDEIIMDQSAHTRNYEAGGPSATCGAAMYPVEGVRGIFGKAQLLRAVRPESRHAPRSRCVLIEQTSNLGGGAIWPLETVEEVCGAAHEHGLFCHMDGARLLNAVVASGITARAYAEPFDSVWIDFSKGLGAPVGAVLAGSRDFIREAWRGKYQLGGAMRQAGIIAAGAVYALEHHVDRLAEDHANAGLLAEGLGAIDGIEVEPVETNLVFFDISGLGITSATFSERLAPHGLRFSIMGESALRGVTHLDVTRDQIKEALEIIRSVVQNLPQGSMS